MTRPNDYWGRPMQFTTADDAPLSIQRAADELGLTVVGGEINPGDLYLAERNTGPKLLTCSRVHVKNWVVPTDPTAYCFDTWECWKVEKRA